jgi:hypothetical protein
MEDNIKASRTGQWMALTQGRDQRRPSVLADIYGFCTKISLRDIDCEDGWGGGWGGGTLVELCQLKTFV